MAESGTTATPPEEATHQPPSPSHSPSPTTSAKRKRSPAPASDFTAPETTTSQSTPTPSASHSSTPSEPPLPSEEAPPLPNEPIPTAIEPEDDGWAPVWDDSAQSYYFYNRFTQATQWANPRIPSASSSTTVTTATHHPTPPRYNSADNTTELHPAVAGGYNPTIHGSYDPNADYAQLGSISASDASLSTTTPISLTTSDAEYAAAANFNRFTGRFQSGDLKPENFNDENKSKRQMNAFFDVDAAANSHDGRSLRAERAGKKLSKEEIKAYREKHKQRKEEKRRAWLRD